MDELQQLRSENEELRERMKKLDKMNQEQYDLIMILSNQIKAYEVIGKEKRLIW